MSTITKQWLQQKIADMEAARDEIPFGLDEDDSNTLEALRMALASRGAEAVEWRVSFRLDGQPGSDFEKTFENQSKMNEIISLHERAGFSASITPLYTAPPAPVSVPDLGALTKCIVQRLVDYGAADDDAIASAEEFVYNACRAAMLQGAEPVTTAYKLPSRKHFISLCNQFWNWQEADEINAGEEEPRLEWNGSEFTHRVTQALWRMYQASPNYPVIPDGWVMVPVEPTYQMCEAMGLPWESPRFPDRYKAMIAAAQDFREIVNSSTNNFRENAETSTKCWCHTCRPVTVTDSRFVVCPVCGNKRCPHANDHRNACTGSNEPGQEGSAYPAAPQQEVKP